MSFRKPVLVLGDPGQLPPVPDNDGHIEPGYFTDGATPDVMLTEIHRQAADSAIIELATMARIGQPIPYGKFGYGVNKVPRINDLRTYLKADQVICGTNKTRVKLNKIMRELSGFSGPYPMSADEKIICLTNERHAGLYNGMPIRLREIKPVDKYWIEADIYDEDDSLRSAQTMIYNGRFFNHYEFDSGRIDREWAQRRGVIEADYAWAITCHKAQGSQWPTVIVHDESDRWAGEDSRRWLYTALTRAADKLVIVEDSRWRR